MISRWLVKRINTRLEEQAPNADAGEAIEQFEAKTASGEGAGLLITKDGRVTSVPSRLESSSAAEDLLARLTTLHDRGALTDAEFEEQKQQILQGGS